MTYGYPSTSVEITANRHQHREQHATKMTLYIREFKGK
jgi:hypothetical protein